MLKLLVVLVVLASVSAQALELDSFTLKSSKDGHEIVAKFDSGLGDTVPAVEFINETIQIDIAGAQVRDGKILNRVDSGKIKSLFAYQLDDSTARLRIILKSGVSAESFKESLKITGEEGLVRFQLPDSSARPAVAKKETAEPKVETKVETPLPVVLKPREIESAAESQARTEQVDDRAIEAELQNLMATKPAAVPQEAKPAAVAEAKAVVQEKGPSKAAVEESQIPAFSQAAVKKEKAASSSTARVLFALVILAATLGGVWLFANRWMGKRNLKNPHTSIRVLTQHYLGPKKSLAIISVAGESILIGITDQNISLIKTLALLEEELPQHVPQDFKTSLDAANSDENDSVEDYAVKGVKDIVNDRLKGMRNFLT